jgi:hypothetical protein
MATEDIRAQSVRLFPHSARLEPAFGTRAVLSPDPFAYVRLKMQRAGQRDALVYWRQAEEFLQASSRLSAAASPLTSYYCILNAVKALLTLRSHPHGDKHGLTGSHTNGPVSLAGETVEIAAGGVFPALTTLYGVTVAKKTVYTLKDLLSEIPFVHRSFALTYTSTKELFFPLETGTPRFVRKKGGTEAWFTAEIPPSYTLGKVSLPAQFERDDGVPEKFIVRCKRRFQWEDGDVSGSLVRLCNYHHRLQDDVLPIVTNHLPRWYLRAAQDRKTVSQLPLIAKVFAAMHRLSELSRYDPIRLERHLQAKHNWLLNEFLAQGTAQVVHLVAREMAGREFINPDSVRLSPR